MISERIVTIQLPLSKLNLVELHYKFTNVISSFSVNSRKAKTIPALVNNSL